MNNKIYLSENAGVPLKEFLKQNTFQTVEITGRFSCGLSAVYDEIRTHADIYMCKLGLWDSSALFIGQPGKLLENYPGNIIYNAVCTGKYLTHNFRYTDKFLMDAAVSMFPEMKKVNVKQGYTRCTCLPVDETSFITSDMGIFYALKEAGASVLLISSGHIALPGFDYGFIGGCAGHLIIDNRRTVIFNGDLSSHPDFEKITAFIEDRDIDIVYFKEYELTDIGSILLGIPASSPTEIPCF